MNDIEWPFNLHPLPQISTFGPQFWTHVLCRLNLAAKIAVYKSFLCKINSYENWYNIKQSLDLFWPYIFFYWFLFFSKYLCPFKYFKIRDLLVRPTQYRRIRIRIKKLVLNWIFQSYLNRYFSKISKRLTIRPRNGMIIEWPQNDLFNDGREVIISSQ